MGDDSPNEVVVGRRTPGGRWRVATAMIALGALAATGVACGADTADVVPEMVPETVPEVSAVGGESIDPLADVDVIDAWVRAPAMGQSVAAAYVTVVNDGDAAVILTAVSSPLAAAELHETLDEGDGVMRMRERAGGFEIAAGAELVMEPGGAHIMLLDIDRLAVITAGEVPLVLDFATAGTLEVVATVRDELSGGHGEHGEHDEMHDGSAPDAGTDEPADELADPGPPDPHLLHDLDDELHAGVFDEQRQVAMVAAFRASLDHAAATGSLPAGFDLDAMHRALDDLEAALVAGDVELAARLAFEAHDIAHGLDHSH